MLLQPPPAMAWPEQSHSMPKRIPPRAVRPRRCTGSTLARVRSVAVPSTNTHELEPATPPRGTAARHRHRAPPCRRTPASTHAESPSSAAQIRLCRTLSASPRSRHPAMNKPHHRRIATTKSVAGAEARVTTPRPTRARRSCPNEPPRSSRPRTREEVPHRRPPHGALPKQLRPVAATGRRRGKGDGREGAAAGQVARC